MPHDETTQPDDASSDTWMGLGLALGLAGTPPTTAALPVATSPSKLVIGCTPSGAKGAFCGVAPTRNMLSKAPRSLISGGLSE
jgi:hypothetical protein